MDASPDTARLDARSLTTPDVGGRPLPRHWSAAFDLGRLERWPLSASRERQAHDAADVLLVDTLAGWAADGRDPAPVAVLHDQHGAVCLPLLAQGLDVRLGVDEASAARSVRHNLEQFQDADGRLPAGWGELTVGGVDGTTLAGARTMLLSLPRALDALHLTASAVAVHAADDVLVLGAGRDKHMSPAMNDVLARSFRTVVPGRGRSKSRVLTAAHPRPDAAIPAPRTRVHRLAGLGEVTLVGGWATFGGAAADPGSRLLARTLAERSPALPEPHAGRVRTASGLEVDLPWRAPASVPDVVDAGSGNGLLAVVAARVWPEASVLASDQSADAVASSAATAAANGLADRITAVQDDALGGVPDGSVRAVVLNPPFHDATAVDPTVAHRMIEAAGRVLAPGGQLWCVWNSHLRHRPVLEAVVGPTRQVARDRTFTVTVSTRA
ncbi:class I SAM-dependent methyltransferase [Micrococcus flavus]|uniref:16S rRNA (Guanine1207-N2)-methyltransferase n=1 Tax=Micrococcus flavus TaxID=384602 RepID=A0A7W7L466_9MICC|nr:methyltransferase [Micrococcus flavus]MBB4882731.1 16S rRNA (guanine1207-N2)-methyltransferase [Micrococcus flavus]GGK39759.1 hypothetical protein GCM10007073_03060 [Micrococcus flavus]